MNIGKVIKQERLSLGENRRIFAERLGITASALWKIETGRTWPTQETIRRFTKDRGYPVARLYIEALEPSDYAI